MCIVKKCDECGKQFKSDQDVEVNEKVVCGKCVITLACKHHHEAFYIKGIEKERVNDRTMSKM
jgi:hypothetical protein